jgi:hypothetical protein
MKKISAVIMSLATVFTSFAFAMPVLAIAPDWDVSGNYVIDLEYLGDTYTHDMTLSQNSADNLTGNGGSPAGSSTYLWSLDTGSVVSNTLTFSADYTATPDAVTPQTTMDVVGTIAPEGTMSGTWSDNYAGGERSGTWMTTSGIAASSTATETVTVTIEKYISGTLATGASANNADFAMSASWVADNIGSSTGTYTLSDTNTIPYEAETTDMSIGADYATNEIIDGAIVGVTCTDEVQYALVGYSSGTTKSAAMNAAKSTTSPAFTNLQNDMYVIVWNKDCAIPDTEIEGEVIGGNGILAVTSIDMTDTSATANGSFADGWKYVFHVTTPTNEPNIAMKFNDWLRTSGAGTIAVANNMRISSLQADNSGATILLTAANVYSSPALHITGDLDPGTDGRQIEITVEVAIPSGTPNGAYTTAYGVQSNP